MPKELAALVRAHTRGEALAPVMRIQTSRRYPGSATAAAELAELAADHVGRAGHGAAALSRDDRGRVVTGGPKLLKAIDNRLRSAARPAATGTKLQRALGSRLPTTIAAPETR